MHVCMYANHKKIKMLNNSDLIRILAYLYILMQVCSNASIHAYMHTCIQVCNIKKTCFLLKKPLLLGIEKAINQ